MNEHRSAFGMVLDHALEESGWRKAAKHFDNACAAALLNDDAAYNREIAAFKRISKTWESTREPCAPITRPVVNHD